MTLGLRCPRRWPVSVYFAMILSLGAGVTRADEPYARSKDYDLQSLRIHLWFDLDQRKIRGEVSEAVSALRDDVADIKLDSVGLTIQSVAVDGKAAKFSSTANNLFVPLARPAKRGEQHEIFIRYEGRPKKGLYFILPDQNYPRQPQEIWTQGEAEDTRNYIPLYDYPNDRLTSEMLLTVPASWITISNGKLVGVKAEADGTKTWDWKQSDPLSSYLISAIAGDFVEKDDSWRGMPLRYVVPRGQEYKIDPSFSHTKEMLDLFSDKAGRALSVGPIRADFRGRFCRRRNGKHQRDDSDRARTREPSARARKSHGSRLCRVARTVSSVVRRPGDLQGLGGSLAQ